MRVYALIVAIDRENEVKMGYTDLCLTFFRQCFTFSLVLYRTFFTKNKLQKQTSQMQKVNLIGMRVIALSYAKTSKIINSHKFSKSC